MSKNSSEKLKVTVQGGISLAGNFYENCSANNGILLFPGVTEHRSSLEGLALELSSEFKVWTFDINSQGESTGDFDLEQMQKSVYEIGKYVKKKHGLSKIGAYGNSIGGMAVGLVAAQEDFFYGVCLTSVPAGIQDVVPGYLSSLMNYVPQSVLRFGTIVFDKLESRKNNNYKMKSHGGFYDGKKYKKYAQFGALKIDNIRNLSMWISNAPRLDDVAKKINSPILLIYGGEDSLLGVKRGVLPDKILNMYKNIGSRDKDLMVINGADHSLNLKTEPDDCFNQDKEFSFLKRNILKHFSYYLL
jgi:alpha-beta hydrolase superfamily lysophospholipase